MKSATIKIDRDILTILEGCTLTGLNLTINQQLETKTYKKLNDVLEIMGGKWNRKLKCHIFPKPVDDILNDVLNYGEILDENKALQFFETPDALIDKMILIAGIKPTDYILEPSAGKGAIIKRLLNHTQKENIHAIDIVLRDELAALTDPDTRRIGDFLSFDLYPVFDKILMNPPFSNHQDVKHIQHAYTCLKPGGCLVSICSESPFFREDLESLNFRAWLDNLDDCIIDELPDGSFKSSGTMVKTRIVIIRK